MQDGNKLEVDRHHGLDAMAFKLRTVSGSQPGNREWSLRMQFLNCHALLFTSSGQGWITIDGRFIEISPGGVYVGFPGQYVEAFIHTLDEQGMYWMLFDVLKETDSDAAKSPTIQKKGVFPTKAEVFPKSPVSVSHLCKAIEQQWTAGSSLNRFGAQARFQELLYILLEQDALADVRERDSNSDEPLELVRHYIEKNYGSKITIDDLASEAKMSPRHFMRLFKKRYGCSAMEYLTIHRIKQAQMLMLQVGKASLKDIARHVGYQDDMYFRRKFREISGIPPAAFMRNCRQKIVAYHSSAIGALLALKAIPFAAPDNHPWTDYYRRKYERDNVLPLNMDESARLEQLRLAKPDWIVLDESLISRDEKGRLEEIASLCAIPQELKDWRSCLRYVAHALNRVEAAEAWLDRYDKKAAFIRKQMAGTLGKEKVLVIEVYGQRLKIAGLRSMASVFYEDLGLAMPDGMTLKELGEEVSITQLQEMDIDRLYIAMDGGRQLEGLRQGVMQSENWRSIPAVQNGCVDLFPWSPFNEYTAFSHELVLNEVLRLWQNRT
jgi:ABC-type Fe3+-hydroxamate transport system substrate-binding protein/AraC-like DNA-binding protein